MNIVTPEGLLDCLTAGLDRQGTPTIVAVHGIQGTAAIWNPVLSGLAKNCRVLAPNLRGRAGSFAPDDPHDYTMAAFAIDLCSAIAAAPGPVVLVGWSMGSLVALEYLKAFGPKNIRGLVLVSGSCCLAGNTTGDAVWFHSATTDALATEAADRVMRLGLTESATNVAVAGSWLSARDADYRAELAEIKIPTLVLHGDEDSECPESHGRFLADHLPNASLQIWEGCGHIPMSFSPDRFTDTLANFMSTCAAFGLCIDRELTSFRP